MLAKDFGRMIKSLRLSHRLTQHQLANQLGVDKSFVSKIENGKAWFPISDEALNKLAQAFGISQWRLTLLCGKLPNGLEESIALYLAEQTQDLAIPTVVEVKIKIQVTGKMIVTNRKKE